MNEFLTKLLNKGYDFLIVVAAGNANSNDKNITVDAQYASEFLYIKDFRIRSRIIGVGSLKSPDFNSTNHNYSMSSFSNVGDRVDILAPGRRIYSCAVTGKGYDHNLLYKDVPDEGVLNYNYCYMQGTSMAAPNVTGILGLGYSVCPIIQTTRLKGCLTTNSSDYGLQYNVANAADMITDLKDIFTKMTTSGKDNSSDIFEGNLMGFVVDQNDIALQNVEISVLKRYGDNQYSETTNIVKSDDSGEYYISLSAGEYKILYSKEGYLSSSYYVKISEEETIYIPTIKLFPSDVEDEEHLIYGLVTNAITTDPVEGALVRFRSGWNNKDGDYIKDPKNPYASIILMTTTTGHYEVSLPVGNYTAEISKDGYITSYANVTTTKLSSIQYAIISPKLSDDVYRIVLTWGNTPSDLDSYLTGNIYGEKFQVNYYNQVYNYNNQTIATRDVDDTSGYGPETITITLYDSVGNFEYFIEDYTNNYNPNSMALSLSSAKVVVYKGNSLLATYHVPSGKTGRRWNVFSIIDGELKGINKIV